MRWPSFVTVKERVAVTRLRSSHIFQNMITAARIVTVGVVRLRSYRNGEREEEKKWYHFNAGGSAQDRAAGCGSVWWLMVQCGERHGCLQLQHLRTGKGEGAAEACRKRKQWVVVVWGGGGCAHIVTEVLTDACA